MSLTIHHSPPSKLQTSSQRAFDARIASIEENRLPVLFLSPHLDDAILSAGGLIAHLAPRTSVTVITVFTEGSSPPYSPFAQQCLQNAGYEEVHQYFQDRRTEDAQVCKKFGADHVHLGFIDAPWRRKDIESVRSIQINPKDISLIPRISEKIGRIIKDHSSSVVFGPLAIGRHVDHLITREALVSAVPNPIFWSDFPYNATDTPDPIYLATHHLQPALWTNNQEEKAEGIKGYQTQIKSLFPDGKISLPSDYFFLTPRYIHPE